MEKRICFAWLLLCFCFSVQVSFAQDSVALIPKPKLYQLQQGYFYCPAQLEVYASEEFIQTADLLHEYPNFHFETVHKLKSLKKLPEKGLLLLKAESGDRLAPHAYRLEVDSAWIRITAHDTVALLNGMTTLRQLALLQDDSTILPALLIEDEPRFAYRGLMLDVSRHFYPIDFLKKYIDLMSIYKLNTFHWHLTDGAGWRLEIKRYPELTQKAAWRTYTNWNDWWNKGRRYATFGDPNASGGYYTQEEAKELVAYAAKRGITIVPEIEMPGHSEEVLAVYPQLSCTGEAYKHAAFCIGNPETFVFLKNVLDEVLNIFPSPYIHIGGDEVDKKDWKACPKCQQLIKDQHLENEEGLQSYAVKQIASYLKEKGRKLIGWDEILQGGLAPEATVMSWRGEQGGITAANDGHDVIMTPGAYLYFDGYQSNPTEKSEIIGGFLPIKKVYQYEPVPTEIAADKKGHVLGLQANVWTEYMPTTERVEYMAFPRALALSEVGWTEAELRSWPDFKKRLQKHYALMQKLKVNYYRPSFEVSILGHYDLQKLVDTISIVSEQHQPEIRYTIDGSEPNWHDTRYVEPFTLMSTTTVKAAIFEDTVRVGGVTTFTVDIHKAIGKKVIYNSPWSEKYPAKSDSTLVNGNYGGFSYGDGEWQGFEGDFDVTLDFERREELHEVKLRFMQIAGPGVYMPGSVKLLASDDGKHFRELQQVKNDIPTSDTSLRFKTFKFDLKGRQARYIRIIGENNQKGFLFTDELVVY